MSYAREGDLSARETARLIAAEKVDGTAVYNRAGEKLGTIQTIMIDKYTGKVAYAVLSFGGFLGLGDHYHALPWNLLKYDLEQGGYVVDLDKRALQEAPSFRQGETAHWEDEAWGRLVHDYYKTPYFWV